MWPSWLLMTAMLASATSASAREPLRYLALGDSYTIGEGVEASRRWPVQLVARLQAEGISVDPPRIIARTGWTTDELSAAMAAVEPLGEWDFVSLLIGVNNQYRGRTVEDYRGEFRALLQRAISLARQRPERVMVLAIPDWGVTPFAEGRDRAGIGAELDAYNAAAAEICREHRVSFVDTAAISRARGAEATMLAEDGLHPSAELYALWANAALPLARDLLSR